MVSITGYAAFMVLAVIAAYVQTLTGFAFGLLLLSGASLVMPAFSHV